MLYRLLWMTLLAPRRVADILLDLRLPMYILVECAALVVLLSGLLSYGMVVAMPPPDGGTAFLLSPIAMILLQATGFVAVVLATFLIGKIFGGTGDLPRVTLALCWLQFVMLFVQLAQFLVAALLLISGLPGELARSIESVTNVAAIAFYLILFTNFVAEAHRFKSALNVLGGIVVIIAGLALVLSTLIVAL